MNALKDEKGVESEYYWVRVLEVGLIPRRVRTLRATQEAVVCPTKSPRCNYDM